MSFTVADCYQGITELLMNRPVATATMQSAIKKAVFELTEDYKHPLLEATGPTVATVAFQNIYPPTYFLTAPDATAALDIEKVNSFFIYNNPYAVPSLTNSQANSGYDLKFMAIKDMEVLLNIPGIPIYWSRNNNQIYLGSMPQSTYNLYMRYQKEHPFSNPIVGTDQIMMANSWQDVLEYAAAMRCAQQINLSTKATELQARLYGDQKFQTSGGIEGAPGLIFQRTSQRNRDQSTTTRRLRLRMGSV
jgi:hypothetical protein